MEGLEYITYKAMIECDQGSVPGLFTPTYNQTIKINSCLVSTKADQMPLTNIPDFVVCKKTKGKCTPAPTSWLETYPVKVKGQPTLIGQSCNNCAVGGKISFLTSGQVPLTPEEEADLQGMRDDVKKAYDEEQEEKNKPWWKKAGEFIVDCVPVVGPIVSLVKNVSKGNWGMALLDVGFLALDVVSLVAAPFTGGASVAGAAAVKVGARQAIKGAVKQVAKKLSKEALEAAAKQTAEMLSKLTVRRLTGGRLCVFACFPAGTPVATKDGLKNIEEIQIGDEVWSYDEYTGEIGLKTVINTFDRDAELLVKLVIDGEIIITTPEHPFYANGEWKEAGLLNTNDSVMLFSGRITKVAQVEYIGTNAPVEILQDDVEEMTISEQQPEKVYNFEVADWHSYFVGLLGALVHNSGICVKKIVKKTGDTVYDITLKFKAGWTKAQKQEALEKCKALTNAKNKTVVKKPPRLPDTRGRFTRSGGKVKKSQDVDHTHELQLGGKDEIGNMKGINSSVNRSVGSQINKAIKPLPQGTKIRKISIK